MTAGPATAVPSSVRDRGRRAPARDRRGCPPPCAGGARPGPPAPTRCSRPGTRSGKCDRSGRRRSSRRPGGCSPTRCRGPSRAPPPPRRFSRYASVSPQPTTPASAARASGWQSTPPGIGGRRVPVAGRDVEVAAEDERLSGIRAPGQVVAKRAKPLELVVPVLHPGHRLPVRHIRGDDPHASHPDIQEARLVARPAGGKAPLEDLRGLAGEYGDPVPGGLRVHHGAVSRRLDVQPGEGLRRSAKLLETEHVRLVTLEQTQRRARRVRIEFRFQVMTRKGVSGPDHRRREPLHFALSSRWKKSRGIRTAMHPA